MVEKVVAKVEKLVPKLVFRAGKGSVRSIGDVSSRIGARGSCLLLCSPEGERDGRSGEVSTCLRRAGFRKVFVAPVSDSVCTLGALERMNEAGKVAGAECVVAVGSPGVLDVGRGVASVLGEGGMEVSKVLDRKEVKDGIPCILIPSCPSGRELQTFSEVVLDKVTVPFHCSSRNVGVVVDPGLFETMRPEHSLTTGVSTLMGAIESVCFGVEEDEELGLEAVRVCMQALTETNDSGVRWDTVDRKSWQHRYELLAQASMLLGAVRRGKLPVGPWSALGSAVGGRYKVGRSHTIFSTALSGLEVTEDIATDQNITNLLNRFTKCASILSQPIAPSHQHLPSQHLHHLFDNILPSQLFPKPLDQIGLTEHDLEAIARAASVEPSNRALSHPLSQDDYFDIL